MCDRPVIEVCPVEWGRMPGRTVLQWDKDDCAEIGLVKFDLLGLGMLSAIQYCFEFDRVQPRRDLRPRRPSRPKPLRLRHALRGRLDRRVPGRVTGADGDAAPAQAAQLLRPGHRGRADPSRPDPGRLGAPVTSGARTARSRSRYPHPRLEEPLERTLGIPLFQEQLMQLAVAVADFTPSEADQLRRAMGSKRSRDKIEAMRIRLYDGMAANGITGATADEIYEKIKAFAAFGFAESHSISFALLVYASSWLKRHYPAAFCAALLNAQPMGFYSPQSLVHDAKRHGVEVRKPVAVGCSAGAAPRSSPAPARRSARAWTRRSRRCGSGSSSVRTHRHRPGRGDRRGAATADGPFTSMADLARRVGPVGRPGRGAGHRRRVRRLRPAPPRGAVGGRRGGHRRPGQLDVDDRSRAGAGRDAGDDRARAAHRRHVGHRDHPRRCTRPR